METAALLEQVDGVLPAYQARSRSAMARFIDVAEELMRERHFDEVSVEDFVSAAGLSVGAFYKRFEDKNAYFRALRVVANHEYGVMVSKWQDRFVELDYRLEPCIVTIVDTVLQHCRDRRGLIRSALRRLRSHEEWIPYARTGGLGVDAARSLIPHIAGDADEDRVRKYEFAFRTIYSIATRATDDDPIPGALDDPGLSGKIVELISLYWRSQSAG